MLGSSSSSRGAWWLAILRIKQGHISQDQTCPLIRHSFTNRRALHQLMPRLSCLKNTPRRKRLCRAERGTQTQAEQDRPGAPAHLQTKTNTQSRIDGEQAALVAAGDEKGPGRCGDGSGAEPGGRDDCRTRARFLLNQAQNDSIKSTTWAEKIKNGCHVSNDILSWRLWQICVWMCIFLSG